MACRPLSLLELFIDDLSHFPYFLMNFVFHRFWSIMYSLILILHVFFEQINAFIDCVISVEKLSQRFLYFYFFRNKYRYSLKTVFIFKLPEENLERGIDNVSFNSFAYLFVCLGFSSPELIAQMSFSDRLLSVIHLCVCM